MQHSCSPICSRDGGIETAHRFFAGTASTYDLCVDLCTLGMDRWWKKKILRKVPGAPGHMLDQACGTGILTLLLARSFTSCRITGVDLHREYLDLAARKARALGLKNVHWVQGRAEEVIFREQYDFITSSYLAKYADMDLLVQGAGKMLRQGGVLAVHDFSYPRSRFLSGALGIYFRIMRTSGSRAFPQWKIVFNELEAFLKQSRWVSELTSSLEKNGFSMITTEHLTMGFATIVSAVHRGRV